MGYVNSLEGTFFHFQWSLGKGKKHFESTIQSIERSNFFPKKISPRPNPKTQCEYPPCWFHGHRWEHWTGFWGWDVFSVEGEIFPFGGARDWPTSGGGPGLTCEWLGWTVFFSKVQVLWIFLGGRILGLRTIFLVLFWRYQIGCFEIRWRYWRLSSWSTFFLGWSEYTSDCWWFRDPVNSAGEEKVVDIPVFLGFYNTHPRWWSLGFLNHQHYVKSLLDFISYLLQPTITWKNHPRWLENSKTFLLGPGFFSLAENRRKNGWVFYYLNPSWRIFLRGLTSWNNTPFIEIPWRIHGTGRFTYIYHKNHPNVGKYIYYTWILWWWMLCAPPKSSPSSWSRGGGHSTAQTDCKDATSAPSRALASLKWLNTNGQLQWEVADLTTPVRSNPRRKQGQAPVITPPMLPFLEEQAEALCLSRDERWTCLLASGWLRLGAWGTGT